jgi:EthD domain
MQRLLMLLADDEPASLEGELRAHESALARIAESAGARLRLAVQLERDPMSAEAARGTRVIAQPRGLVELTVEGADPEPLLGVVREIATELRNAVDWPASVVSVGTVNQVLPAASDEILLTLAAIRLPSIDRATFAKYWLDTHAALAMSMLSDEQKAKMGYQQIHANEDASARATVLAGAKHTSYDGVLQCALAKVTDLPHLTVPGFAEVIAKDEQNFTDPSAAMLGSFMRTLPTRIE